MLLEFACSNHKSIRDEVMFSAVAGKDVSHKDNIERKIGVDVLKAAVIYGANGSGKSNFIDAISFVKRLVTNSINHQPGQGIRQTPHKLDGFDKESSYKVQFIVDDTRYAFGFSLRNMLVTEEYLYYFPNSRQTKIFERLGEKFTAGAVRMCSNQIGSCYLAQQILVLLRRLLLHIVFLAMNLWFIVL